MEQRKQPTRRCKAKTAPEDVQWEEENVAAFSPRPFLKTEQIPVELHPTVKPAESDNEEYSQVNPKCLKCELDVDCKKKPGVPEFSVPCSSKSSSSSSLKNSKFSFLHL